MGAAEGSRSSGFAVASLTCAALFFWVPIMHRRTWLLVGHRLQYASAWRNPRGWTTDGRQLCAPSFFLRATTIITSTWRCDFLYPFFSFCRVFMTTGVKKKKKGKTAPVKKGSLIITNPINIAPFYCCRFKRSTPLFLYLFLYFYWWPVVSHTESCSSVEYSARSLE